MRRKGDRCRFSHQDQTIGLNGSTQDGGRGGSDSDRGPPRRRRIHPRAVCSYYHNAHGCRWGDECQWHHVDSTPELRRDSFFEFADPRYTVASPLRGGLKAIPWNRIRTVKLFDFDGTLIISPTRDGGAMQEYERITGEPWPHGRAFYSVVASLEPPLPILEGPALEEARSLPILGSEEDDRTTLACVLTGRREKFRRRICELLDELDISNRIAFAAFTPSEWKLGSVEYKKAFFEQFLIRKCPGINRMELWDDQAKDIEKFEEWAETQRCFEGGFVTHFVGVEVEVGEEGVDELRGNEALDVEETVLEDENGMVED